MKLVVQRVLSASVTVDGVLVSSIGRGLLVLCGLSNNEEADSGEWCSRRLLGVKLWPNAEGKPWKSSVVDIDGELLLVSQFTLFHRLKGNSPDWSMAMPPDAARTAYASFVSTVQSQYSEAKVGVLHSLHSAQLACSVGNSLTDPSTSAPSGQKWRLWCYDERGTPE
jgi:D-tyrosyl-tRNA(Tyr) deacylase